MSYTNFPNGINAGTIAFGGGTPIYAMFVQGVTLSPAAVAANTTAEQTFAVANVGSADIVLAVNKPTNQAGLGITNVRVSAAGTVAISFCNVTTAAITPTAAQVYQIATMTHG